MCANASGHAISRAADKSTARRVWVARARNCTVHVFVKPDRHTDDGAEKVRADPIHPQEWDQMYHNSKGKSEDEVRNLRHGRVDAH